MTNSGIIEILIFISSIIMGYTVLNKTVFDVR